MTTLQIRNRASRELRTRGYPVILPLAFTAGLVSEADGSWTGDQEQQERIRSTAAWKLRVDDLRKYCDEQEKFVARPRNIPPENQSEEFTPIRGILFGILFSLPFWLVLALVWSVWK